MKILALTRYGRMGASSRLRTFQYVVALREYGIDVQVSPLLRDHYIKRLYGKQTVNWMEVFSDYFGQAMKLLQARRFDLLWIEKELFPNLPAWFERFLSTLGIRYIVDYDDAVFHNYDLSRHPYKKLLAKKIDKVMHDAALVICGNSYLAERARAAGATRVEILPTVIDLDRYSVVGERDHEPLVVGWVGSPSTVKYLEIVEPALAIVANQFPLQFRVIGANFSATGLDVVCRPWSEATEVPDIQDFDIGIMPLHDLPWEKGKCGYKLIQYMACGLPLIASPVGANLEIVEHEKNGLLVSSKEEWIEAIRILRDPITRFSMGTQGRKSVENKYCLQRTTQRLAHILRDTIETVD